MRIKKFNEVNINFADLQKQATNGLLRGDVLVSKLKKQIDNPEDEVGKIIFNSDNKRIDSPVTNADEIINNITDGDEKSFDVEKAKNFLTKGRNYIKRFSVDDEQFKLNDIEKTKDFGSSSGSSLGTEQTIVVESIQCLICALRQKMRQNITINDIFSLFDRNGNIHSNLISQIEIPISLNSDIINQYVGSWGDTFVKTANSLFEEKSVYVPKLSSDKKDRLLSGRIRYKFCQINSKSRIVESIRANYKRFVVTKGIPIEKWNPSDLWIISFEDEENIINSLRNCDTLVDFNSKIDEFFLEKKLIGVSLKKLKENKDVNLLINKVTPRPTYKFLKVRTSSKPLSSLGVHVLLEQRSSLESECRQILINFRTFNGKEVIGDISGEITGTSARYGKISLKRINQILSSIKESFGVEELGIIQNYKELSTKTNKQLYIDILKMNDLVGRFGDKITSIESGERVEPAENEYENRVRLVSKYQALNFAKILYQSSEIEVDDKNLSDLICQRIMYYALAIQNDVFESPIYIRIV